MSTENQYTKRRFPGARPFEEDEQHLFFGREEEVEALFNQLFVEQVAVLYGQSGIGKSSLIKAGLIPRLLEEYHTPEEGEPRPVFQPVVFRFGDAREGGAGLDDIEKAPKNPVDSFKHTFTHAFDTKPGHFFKGLVKDTELRLWHLLKSYQLTEPEKPVPILILDQFEELFTYPETSIARFRGQLAELLMTKAPQDLRDQLATRNDGEAMLRQLLHLPLKFKILLGIRSDKFSLLNRLQLPALSRKLFEIQPLSRTQANRALVLPAKYPLDSPPYSPAFTFEGPSRDKILDFLTRKGEKEVEAFQLQVLCYYFESKVIGDGLREVQVDSDERLNEIYANFYDLQLEEHITNEIHRQAARDLIEEALIFEEGKRRTQAFGIQLKRRFGVSQDLLDTLVNKTRLIREIPEGEHVIYEVSHDSLVEPILRSRAARQRILEQERQEEAERRARQLAERNRSMEATEAFIRNEIDEIRPGALRRKVWDTLLEKFVDEELKVRQVIEKNTLLNEYGWTEQALQKLIGAAMLEEIDGGVATLYRLSDDRLMKAVLNIKGRDKRPSQKQTSSWSDVRRLSGSTRGSLSGMDWEFLLDSIHEEKCVLVMGSRFPTEEDGRPLQSRLPDFLEVGANPRIASYDAEEHLFQFGSASEKLRTYYQIRKFYDLPASRVYEQLARIPFHCYLSLSPDLFLFQAYQQLGLSCHFTFYSRYKEPAPVPRPSVKHPLIYNLYGSVEDEESLNLTFDDLSGFIAGLVEGRGIPPEIRKELLDANIFLLLDYTYTPYSRLVLRYLLPIKANKAEYYSINREPLAAQARDRLYHLLPVNFIEMQTEAFIEELYQRAEVNGLLRQPEAANLSTDTNRIKEMIASGKIEEAMILFENVFSQYDNNKELMDDFFILRSNWMKLTNQNTRGILSIEEGQIQENRIRYAFLSLVNRLNK